MTTRAHEVQAGGAGAWPARWPGLMVSVSDAREAAAALDGGADWIDVKDPRRGALGAASAEVLGDVAEVVGAARTLSAALGEWVAPAGACSRRILVPAAYRLVKIGLSGQVGRDWPSQWRLLRDATAAGGKSLVAVAYADAQAAAAPSPGAVVEVAAETPGSWILFDTFDKRGPRLAELFPRREVTQALQAARRADLRIVLAGRLQATDLGDLPLEAATLIAVRGAVCSADRSSAVVSEKVAQFAAALAAHQRPAERLLVRSDLTNCRA